MKHKILISIFSLILMLSFGSVEQVLACSCFPEKPICEAFGDAKAIFVGEVIEGNSVESLSERLKNNSKDLSFTFKVTQNFLGTEENKNIVVHTGFGFGDCGVPFQNGETYLVYAYEFDGKLKTTICTRTRLAARVDKDFDELASLLSKSGAKISGTVQQYAKHSLEKDSIQPKPDLRLQIEQLDGQKKKIEVITDKFGKYEITGLSTGKYKIIPMLSNGLMVDDFQMSEFWLNDKGCAVKDFGIKNNSGIEGRVIDSEGKAIDNLAIDLFPQNLKSKPTDLRETTYSWRGGIFNFFNIPPGKYLIAANYTSQPDEMNPYPTTFYKAKGEKSIGTVIVVGIGGKVEGLVIQLPSRLPMQEISGKVFWKNGKPAKGVFVNLRDSQTKQNISSADTDSEGNFIIKGFTGRKYIIETYLEEVINGSYVQFESKDVVFILSKKTPKFKVILEKKIEEE